LPDPRPRLIARPGAGRSAARRPPLSDRGRPVRRTCEGREPPRRRMDPMRYMLLLAAADDAMPQPGTAASDEEMAAFAAFDEVARHAIVAGEALEDRSTCRSVRHDGGELAITDGPFAESVEGLGAFIVLDVADLDEALELARQVPSLTYGPVEVRPV